MPRGYDRSEISRHLLGWWRLGITPNRLICAAVHRDGGKGQKIFEGSALFGGIHPPLADDARVLVGFFEQVEGVVLEL